MTIASNTTESRGATPPTVVEVWDQAVRVLYWSLAAYLILAYATGDQAGRLHGIAGYAIAIHLALRVVWGLARQYHHARSCNFVSLAGQLPPDQRAAGGRVAPRHFAHHPAGAAMIGAFLTTVGCICITGVMMTTDAFWQARWLQDLHATLASVAVGLVVLHVVGMMVTRLINGESLVKTDTQAAMTAKRRSGRVVASSWGR